MLVIMQLLWSRNFTWYTITLIEIHEFGGWTSKCTQGLFLSESRPYIPPAYDLEVRRVEDS